MPKPDPNALMTVVIFPEGTKFEVKTGTEAEIAPVIHKTPPAFRFVFDGSPLDVKVAMSVVRHHADSPAVASDPPKVKTRRTDEQIGEALKLVAKKFAAAIALGHRARPAEYKSGSPEAVYWAKLLTEHDAKANAFTSSQS